MNKLIKIILLLLVLFSTDANAIELNKVPTDQYRLKYTTGYMNRGTGPRRYAAGVCYGPFYDLTNTSNTVLELFNVCLLGGVEDTSSKDVSAQLTIEPISLFGILGYGISTDSENGDLIHGVTLSINGLDDMISDIMK